MVIKGGDLDISMESPDTSKDAKDGTLESIQAVLRSPQTRMIHFLDSKMVVIVVIKGNHRHPPWWSQVGL